MKPPVLDFVGQSVVTLLCKARDESAIRGNDMGEKPTVDEGEFDPRAAAALLEQTAGTWLVYGILPAAGPLIVVGAAAAGYAAAREDTQLLAFAVAAVALGAGSAFSGPAGVWGVAGVGWCALLVCRAITQVWLRPRNTA